MGAKTKEKQRCDDRGRRMAIRRDQEVWENEILECVCVREWERERENKCRGVGLRIKEKYMERERKREKVSVCVRERERVCEIKKESRKRGGRGDKEKGLFDIF